MARTKHNKPGGRRRHESQQHGIAKPDGDIANGSPENGSSEPPQKKRRASDAELDENGNGVVSKRKIDVADVLQNSSSQVSGPDALVQSKDPMHPANHICALCRKFYNHGWVTGTGGGVSIRDGKHIFIAPSGVQKELLRPTDMFVMDFESQAYLRRPAVCHSSIGSG